MSDILAEVRSLAVVAVLALTGCGSGHDKPKPPDWRFRTAELVAGAVALALRQELDQTAALGDPPPAAAGHAEQLRRARRAMLVVLVGEIRAARDHDLKGIQHSIRRLTRLSHTATVAAAAAGLRICGHELDRGITELPA
jgi:hypothetical protein